MPSPGPPAQPPLESRIPSNTLRKNQTPVRPSGKPVENEDGDEDIDPLFHADDRTLDEFLESLDLEEDVSLDQPPPLTHDIKDESKKVAALLEELGKPATDPSRGADNDDDKDDDSDGETMSAEVNQILSRALDEAELNRPLSPNQSPQDNAHPIPKADTTVPNSPPQDQPSKADPSSLPSVPSNLADPAPTTSQDITAREDGNASLAFEASIAARMSALRGPASAPDPSPLGLPSPPSFDPDERAEAKPSFAGNLSGGYTDEDQKTWCVVCLEDATVLCVGCGGDVYCGRCWRDMHVGPRAGWDERGHQWRKFERGR